MVERMKIVSTENFDWCLPDSDTHFAEMLSINSEYQFKIKNIILEYAHLLNFENTIDVGANIGLWSRWLSQQGAKNIDCFEPIAKNLECLRKNVQDIQNLNIHEVALGQTQGSITLYIEKSESNVGQHTIDKNYFGESALLKGFTVPVNTLDSYQLAPTFIKIDVQGAEMMVLNGAIKTITQHRPAICIECEDPELATIIFLESLGYQVLGNTNSDFLMVLQ
jgi:FkbM family methyltransferase